VNSDGDNADPTLFSEYPLLAGVAGLASALDKPAAAETLERQPSV